MLFNSIDFLFFFVIVTILYFLLPYRFRWILLLASSCLFYMYYIPVYILILASTIVIDYFAGIFIEKTVNKKRKFFLVLSLVANIGILAVFKYFNFLNFNLSWLLFHFDFKNPIPYLTILLPIGLSFHTFQAMSYTIEIYRGNQKAEKHFGIYALYVMFYPQLVAGPIERPQNVLHQFYEKHKYDYKRVTSGLKLMAWGLFKKIVIADHLSNIVDRVYNSPHSNDGIIFIFATVLFSFQIFCDFSGYSDVAIGAAEVMGFKLMKNFDKPYHAKSISEFWSKWHISLSTWFRDYLYIPLGGNRVAVPRWYLNLFIVFLISGLWHGANWTFIVWGALHGFYLVFALATKNSRSIIANKIGLTKYKKVDNFLNITVTFILVSIAWIFFRAASVQDAFYIFIHSFTGFIPQIIRIIHHQPLHSTLGGINNMDLLAGIGGIILMECIHIMQNKYKLRDWISSKPVLIRWTVYYACVLSIVFLGVHEAKSFIYFQF